MKHSKVNQNLKIYYKTLEKENKILCNLIRDMIEKDKNYKINQIKKIDKSIKK